MDLKKKLLDLGITNDGYESNDSFIADVNSSDEYAKIYTMLDSSDSYNFVAEKSKLDEHNSVIYYEGTDCDIRLIANFDDDLYRVALEETK